MVKWLNLTNVLIAVGVMLGIRWAGYKGILGLVCGMFVMGYVCIRYDYRINAIIDWVHEYDKKKKEKRRTY